MTNTNTVNHGSITQHGFTVLIRKDTTQTRAGNAVKVFYTLDFASLQTGDNLATFCKGFGPLLSFFEADFNKAMVSLQCTTPANGNPSKVLSDSDKMQALRDYVSTIDTITRRK